MKVIPGTTYAEILEEREEWIKTAERLEKSAKHARNHAKDLWCLAKKMELKKGAKNV